MEELLLIEHNHKHGSSVSHVKVNSEEAESMIGLYRKEYSKLPEGVKNIITDSEIEYEPNQNESLSISRVNIIDLTSKPSKKDEKLKGVVDFVYDPLVGLDVNNNPVREYSQVKSFEVLDPENSHDEPLCYGIYTHYDNGERENIADVFEEDQAKSICDIMNSMIELI